MAVWPNSVEVWYNSGDPDFPLSRIQGAYNEIGCIAPYSVAKMDNSVFWRGADPRGQGIVYRANGYTGVRISTHAVEFAIQGYTDMSDALAYTYQQDGHCLRLLDPAIDSDNHLIPDATMMREAAALSSSEWILPSDGAKMPNLFGPEPKHGWCSFFERAELAAQMGDWARVADLGDRAFELDDHPNDPVERFVFIEGYARSGNISRAIELSEDSHRVSRTIMEPLLCRLWLRLEADASIMPQIAEKMPEIKSMFACSRE